MLKRILGFAGAGVLVGSIGLMAACGSSPNDGNVVSAKQALQSANVTITVHDANGNKIADGSGVMIAPRLVLTAAHLIAGASSWTVTSADGKTVAQGTRGLTNNW